MEHFKTFSLFIMIVACFISCKGDVDQCSLALNCGGKYSSLSYTDGIQAQGGPGIQGSQGIQGNPGVKGEPGVKGQPGDSCQCPEIQALEEKVKLLMRYFKPSSCEEVVDYETNKSVQNIYPFANSDVHSVLCVIRSPTKKWTVIQRRFDGSQDFFLGWDSYKRGFGHTSSEYWLGLDIIHQLTSNEDQMLRVELEDHDGNHAHAEYSSFVVGPESENYTLHVNGYSGNAGDGLNFHNGMMFSTRDRENDKVVHDCANTYNGAWWYNACYIANLNGLYFDTKKSNKTSMNWRPWKSFQPLKSVTMMIKKKK